jgi:hypothetical protein
VTSDVSFSTTMCSILDHPEYYFIEASSSLLWIVHSTVLLRTIYATLDQPWIDRPICLFDVSPPISFWLSLSKPRWLCRLEATSEQQLLAYDLSVLWYRFPLILAGHLRKLETMLLVSPPISFGFHRPNPNFSRF